MAFSHSPDCTSGAALLCVSEEALHFFLREWTEGGLEVFGERVEVSCAEGKVGVK